MPTIFEDRIRQLAAKHFKATDAERLYDKIALIYIAGYSDGQNKDMPKKKKKKKSAKPKEADPIVEWDISYKPVDGTEDPNGEA
jgi:CCR4-NOT transcriptional regulation complex NOT5 subunit